MNVRAVRAIIRKDLKVIVQSRAVLVPLIVVPAVFFVVLPGLLAALAPSMLNMPGASPASIKDFIAMIPAELLTELVGYDDIQKIIVFTLVYLLAPLFLVVPLMVASVIAADSFAGEKERKTLEALLYTPATDQELLLGKMLAAWLPTMGVALGGFVLYGIVVNLAAWPIMGRIFFPNMMWVVLVLWVAPAAAGLGLGTMVLVSSRVKGFQEAYQLGGTVVIPMLLLLFGQVAGVLYFSIGLVLVLGLVLWVVDAALFWFSIRTFKRDELIVRL